LDLLWPIFLLLGWEHVAIEPGITKMAPLNFTYYPISHSLLMACVWGGLFGFIHFLIKRSRRGAIILGLCVLSNWMLDLLVHRPDLPLYPGSSLLVGFGLWNFKAAEIIVEVLLFVVGLAWYIGTTKPKNTIGNYGFWLLICFLAMISVASAIGPPPPNVKAIAWAGMLQWLFVIWAYWVDRNRLRRHADPLE
jgi:hypothetical protein